jgi:two-component system response regulator
MTQNVEILLVEDNQFEAELTLRSLAKSNLSNHVLHVTDGAKALDFIFARNEYASRSRFNVPRLILLDLKLPKINGRQFLKAIKSDERTKTIPVIVLTSSKEENDIASSYELGVNSYIVKPVNFDSFSKAVVELGMYWMLSNVPPVPE